MTRLFMKLLILFSFCQLIFAIWPGLDIWTSSQFYNADTDSWLGTAPSFEVLRESAWNAMMALTLAFAALLIIALILGREARVPARVWGFALTAVIVGPGLIANGILKTYWGRARPRAIAEFEGSAEFTPAFQIADQCASNCSFVAGEVSGASTVALVLWLLFARTLNGGARRGFGLGLVCFTAIVSFLRISAGGHFLSDVVFAILISAFSTLALWKVFNGDVGATRISLSNLISDVKNTARKLTGRRNKSERHPNPPK